jgi:hypothetical protein
MHLFPCVYFPFPYLSHAKLLVKFSIFSPGIMLLIYDRTPSYVPLKILSIEDGKPLKSFRHLLHRGKKIDFIEQFNEKLLVKQEDENLQILDVCHNFMCYIMPLSCNIYLLIVSVTVSWSS